MYSPSTADVEIRNECVAFREVSQTVFFVIKKKKNTAVFVPVFIQFLK